MTKVGNPFGGGVSEALPGHSAFSLAVIWNARARDGFGVGAEGGVGIGDRGERDYERNAFNVVYRRWLRNGMALDVAPGVIRTDVRNPRGQFFAVRQTGATLGVDLHLRHWAVVSVRGDRTFGASPHASAMYVGAKVDGYWALAASLLAAVAYGVAALSQFE